MRITTKAKAIARIARVRKAKGLTQEACADKAHISQVYWCTLESGRKGTRTDEIALLKAMCKAVGLKMTVVIEEA